MYEVVREGTAAQDGECGMRPNREVPDAVLVRQFREKLRREDATDEAEKQICVIKQTEVLAGETCLDAATPGWCYVQSTAAKKPAGKKCSQAIVFQKSTLQSGSSVHLQCVSRF